MKDIDRWLEKMGPEPKGLHELRDAARAAPERTPEQRERMKAKLFAALDEKEREWEQQERRAHTVRQVIGGATVAVAMAAAVVLWMKWPRKEELDTARGPVPTKTSVVRAGHGPLAPTGVATSPSAVAPDRDAGPDAAP